MAKRSLFRDFISLLKKHWREALPSVRPLREPIEGWPKASTFYAGFSAGLQKHVFLNFQHASKAWEVGRFTINVILSQTQQPAEFLHMRHPPNDGVLYVDGHYRIGLLVGSRDKWWHLKKDQRALVSDEWRPTSYANTDAVLAQAVAAVTADVEAVLRKLGVEVAAAGASESSSS